MDTQAILKAIDAEISKLQHARSLLGGATTGRKPGRPAKAASFAGSSNANPPRKRRKMSAAGRKAIAAAQRARWAKVKAAQK